MKLVPFIFTAQALLFSFSSCSVDDEKQKCGEETFAGMVIHNPSEFQYYHDLTVNDAHYTTSGYFDSYALLTIGVRLQNICNTDHPDIDFGVLLHQVSTTVSAWSLIEEDGNKHKIGHYPISPGGTYYHTNFSHNFDGNFGGASGALFLELNVSFKSLGSQSADSTYFYSNLDQMSISITAHKPAN